MNGGKQEWLLWMGRRATQEEIVESGGEEMGVSRLGV